MRSTIRATQRRVVAAGIGVSTAVAIGIIGFAAAGSSQAAAINPHPVNDAYSTPSATQLVVAAPGILSNDFDAIGTHAVVQSGPSHGTLVATAGDGSFRYTPTGAFNGADSFTYCLSATVGGTCFPIVGTTTPAIATVTITVVPPVAVNDSYSTPANTVLNVGGLGILGNDTGLTPTYQVTEVTGPSHGSVTLGGTRGQFSYDPTFGFTGADSFTYCITAVAGTLPCLSNTATVSIDVTGAPATSPVPGTPTPTVSTPPSSGSTSPTHGTTPTSGTSSTAGTTSTAAGTSSSDSPLTGGTLADTGNTLIAPATVGGILALLLGAGFLGAGTWRRRPRQH